MTPKEALLKACASVGGQSALARHLGLRSQGSVSAWLAAGRVPPGRVLAIEAATERKVRAHQLRPDIYPPRRFR